MTYIITETCVACGTCISECSVDDFILGIMLGIMLGYDRLKQCERYLERKQKNGMVEELIG